MPNSYNSERPLRRISSMLTALYKFVLPVLFVAGFFNVVIWRISNPVFFVGLPLAAFLIPLVSLSFILWNYGPAKKVLIDETNKRLYVSNYRKEIAIPFSEIASVSEFMLSDPTRVTIRLHSPSEFGQKIVFLATYRFGGWLAGSHPIVAELRGLVAER